MKSEELHTDNKDGFRLPEGYFGQARHRLLQQVNQGGLKTPDGYFEESRARLLQVTAQRRPARIISLRNVWYAAAALLAVSVTVWLVQPAANKDSGTAQVSNDEIVNYVLASEAINDIPLNELYTNDAAVTHEEEEIVNQLDEETLLNEL